MPPDVLFPEFLYSKGRIECKPEKIFGHPEEKIEGEESELGRYRKGCDAGQVWNMKETEGEQRKIKMVTGERDASQEQPRHTV